jgi:hypothetical protein
MELEEKVFKPEEIEEFVYIHVKQKAQNNELGLAGIDLEDFERFEKDMYIYQNALFEGIVNGIIMAGGKVKGIDIE